MVIHKWFVQSKGSRKKIWNWTLIFEGKEVPKIKKIGIPAFVQQSTADIHPGSYECSFEYDDKLVVHLRNRPHYFRRLEVWLKEQGLQINYRESGNITHGFFLALAAAFPPPMVCNVYIAPLSR